MHKKILALLPFALVALPLVANAHEVYVLSPEIVAKDMTMPPLAVMDIVHDNAGQFFFWTFISVWAVFTVLSISLSKNLERMLDPALAALKRYAPLAGRITLGLAIFASGYFGAMFGPELPFTAFLGTAWVPLFSLFLQILGACIAFGFLTRLSAVALIIIYIGMWPHYGWYMLTYLNYFGEMILVLLVGNASFALDRIFHHRYPVVFRSFFSWFEQHAFLVIRVTFGISLIFASMYAKFFHAQLALDVVTTYHLTDYFPFQPEFIVLGAFAIELLAGLFFLFGIEIRFASLFLLFWLTLSLLYFGEAVWPHIVLAGTAIAIFMRGYDAYTLQFGLMRRFKKRMREPVL